MKTKEKASNEKAQKDLENTLNNILRKALLGFSFIQKECDSSVHKEFQL